MRKGIVTILIIACFILSIISYWQNNELNGLKSEIGSHYRNSMAEFTYEINKLSADIDKELLSWETILMHKSEIRYCLELSEQMHLYSFHKCFYEMDLILRQMLIEKSTEDEYNHKISILNENINALNRGITYINDKNHSASDWYRNLVRNPAFIKSIEKHMNEELGIKQ